MKSAIRFLSHETGHLIFTLLLSVLLFFTGCSRSVPSQPENPEPSTGQKIETPVKPGVNEPSERKNEEKSYGEFSRNNLEMPMVDYFRLEDIDKMTSLSDQEQEYFIEQMGRLGEERHILSDPVKIMDAIGLKKGDCIADIGCGAGFMTFYFANRVGESGKVYAVDNNPRALKFISLQKKRISKETGVRYDNIRFIDNKADEGSKIFLPENSLDIAFLSSVHNLSQPWDYGGEEKYKGKTLTKEDYYTIIRDKNREFMTNIMESIKPGGKLVIIESKKEHCVMNRDVLFEDDIRKILEEYGYRYCDCPDILPVSYILIMNKPADKKLTSK